MLLTFSMVSYDTNTHPVGGKGTGRHLGGLVQQWRPLAGAPLVVGVREVRVIPRLLVAGPNLGFAHGAHSAPFGQPGVDAPAVVSCNRYHKCW